MNFDRVALMLFVIALAFLVFLGGAFAMLGEVFPYAYLHRAYQAGTALYVQRTAYGTPYQTDLWYPARTEARGVTVHDPARAAAGYTLFTSGDGPHALLVDMQGNVIHEWRRPFSTVWNDSSPIRKPRPDEFVYFRKARVFPNGDLLAIYIGSGDTPWGYGMVKLDRDSNLLWYYPGRTHHDFDIAPDGRIYLLTHEFVSPEHPSHLADPYLEDSLVILSADGEELKKVSLIQALANSRYNPLLYTVPHSSTADPLHTNAVERLGPEEAAALPGAEAGDVLLSFRELGAIAVLDVEREEVVWATRGSWLRQHDPAVLPNGNILLFDNLGAFRPGNATRVLELDPRTRSIAWQYQGTAQAPLYSDIRGAVQRLDNGNTLITESSGGRLLEVTPGGDVVWEYVNPVRGGDAGQSIPIVSWGQRIDPGTLTADFRQALTSAAG